MKINRILLAIAFVAGLGFSACDIVDNPIDPNAPTVTSGKKVLIEDFTGAQCGNCPRAHEAVEALKEAYGESVIAIGLHVGGFAEVDSIKGYYHDFTSPFGNALDLEFGADNLGLPVGMVSRRKVSGSPLTRYTNWSTVVASVLSEAPALNIEVDATFQASSRTVTVTSELEYYAPADASHQIVVLITEDSILSKQSDYSLQPNDFIYDYPQRHVVRKSVTPGVYGEIVKNAEIFIGERITKTHTTTLDANWKEEKCYAVVYVLDKISGEYSR